MAIVSAVFLFGLPEDTKSDKFRIYSAATEAGSYSLVTTFNYTYGYRSQEYDSVNDALWYKIQFYNTDDDEAGPYSNPIFGGDFGDKDTPFLALSTSFDGANYSSTTDLYDLTGLTTDDMTAVKVQGILRLARAYIDMVMGDSGLTPYSRTWSTSTARRKYNAMLRLVKGAEVNLAASVVYRSLADDAQRSLAADDTGQGGDTSISIGPTSVRTSEDGVFSIALQSTNILVNLSVRYAQMAASLLNSIIPSHIAVGYSDPSYAKGPLFIHPAEATGNIYVQSNNIGDTFVQYTAVLTGLGDDINGVSFSLEDNAVVEGIAAQSVDPLEAAAALVDSVLTVNGVNYNLDDWVDNGSNTQNGSGGTTGTTDGFSLDFSTSVDYIDMIWNNTDANGGFDLVAGDVISFKYWILGPS